MREYVSKGEEPMNITIVKDVPVETVPSWLQVVFGAVLVLTAIALVVVAYYQNADDETREKWGLGKKGQGR